MELKLNKNILPVLGWSDVSVCSYNKSLANEMNDGEVIIYNTSIDYEDDELCAFIFYDGYLNKKIYSVFTGKVEFIGGHTDHSAPLAYKFYPMKEVVIKGVGYCKCCGEPEEVMLKDKKL
jgi:hypothetical protein